MTSVSIEWEPDILSAVDKEEWQLTIEAAVAYLVVGSTAARFALKDGRWVLYSMSYLAGHQPDAVVTRYDDDLAPIPAQIVHALSKRGWSVRVQWGPQSSP
jgi:hypothetical protein